MGLEVVEIRDLRDFTKDFVSSVIARDVPGSPPNDVSTGWDLGIADGRNIGGTHFYSVYDHIRDRVIFTCTLVKEDTGGTTALRQSIYARDALCREGSVGWWRELNRTYGANTIARLKMGQPNLSTGQQKIYFYPPVTGANVEVNPLNGNPASGALWPQISGDFNGNVGGSALDVAGDWDAAGTTQDEYMPVIFEGITDTSQYTAETDPNAGILVGGNSHPLGLALMSVNNVNLAGGAGQEVGDRWVWIDLDTGKAVGVLGIPILADSNSTNPFAEPTIDGNTFEWDHVQFVPDPGSSFAQPKGELHIYTSEPAAFEFAGRTVVHPGGSFTSTVIRNYVAVHEFNPFNVQSGIVRIHNRRIFLGFYDTPQEPIIDGGSNMTNAQDNVNNRSPNVIYHPPSRTYINVVGRPATVNSEEADAPRVGDSRIIRFRRSSVVGFISKPTPETAVTENRTVFARVICHTDLGDRATGVQVNFDYARVSTRDEQFDGTAQGSSAYQVEAQEIDEDGHLEVREQGGVDDVGGVLLTEGVDYTVNYSTGTLTPATSWPTETIHVRYRHRAIRLTPGHGTLLSTASVTDGSGVVFAQIRYGEDIDGELDSLEATA